LEALNGIKEKNKENTLVLLTLAKKVGISAYGREKVARLYENQWWGFVEEHSKAKVGADLRVKIETLLYDEHAEISDELFDPVLDFVTEWIKTHKAGADV